jgi:protein-S-isoprenylcysteine O-methyltransferase Ste14
MNYYYVFVVLFLVSLTLRSTYEVLKEMRKIDPENRIIFGIIFSVMMMLWASWFALCSMDPFRVDIPETMRWCGLGLLVAGMIVAFGALFQLRGLENIDHLVKTGLFARLRHPMYTGFMLWIVGWSIYHGAFVSLCVGLIGIANIVYWRHLEDSRLLAQYGDVYRQYQLKTWF